MKHPDYYTRLASIALTVHIANPELAGSNAAAVDAANKFAQDIYERDEATTEEVELGIGEAFYLICSALKDEGDSK